jgi:hypothetical protein
MAFAESRGYLTDPNPALLLAPVKANLVNWINYIQAPDGGSGYSVPGNWDGIGEDEAKTGGLLLEMDWAGSGGNMNNAIAYLNANWQNFANGWWGNFGHPYAMWSIYKGLESTIGLNSTGVITNLHTQGPLDLLDPGDTWNWWEDYCNWLVKNQNGDGSWNDFSGYGAWGDPLSTAWNINILLATQVEKPIPEPVTLFGLVAGLGGLVGYVRRRQRA